MEKFIYIFGSRRTSTNYTSLVLKKNFIANIHTIDFKGGLGFKHSPPRDQAYTILSSDEGVFNKHNLFVVIVVKHPYSWMFSRLHYADHIKGERIRKKVDLTRELAARYNEKYKIWKAFADKFPDNILIVRHEDYIENFSQTLERIEKKFGLTRREKSFQNIESRIGPEKREGGGKIDRSFFREERFRTALPPQLFAVTRKIIDWKFFLQFGYTP